MPVVYASALPTFPPAYEEAALRQLCARWDRAAAPRLSPAQGAHCGRFRSGGAALRARASRLLARLLLLRALPAGAVLDMDADGRPLVTGAPGWQAAFTHSGNAAFCLICAPGELRGEPMGSSALDAEAWGTHQPADRAFTAPAPTPAASLRRWVLAEALYKALGAAPARWAAVAAAAHAGATQRGGLSQANGVCLCWRFLAAPGHVLCAALPGTAFPRLGLHWLHWQMLA